MEKDTRYQPLDKASISADQISRPSVSYWKDAWRRFRKDKLAVFGLVMILIVSLFAIFGPMFCPYAYDEADFFSIAQWPSKAHWFGTDALGRDLYVRVLYGARISLSIGVVAALVNMVIGVLYGGIAGYFGGKVDNVMMRIVDIIIALPSLLYTILLMMLVVSLFYPILTSIYGRVIWSSLICTYIGFFLFGLVCIALGIFISSLTEMPLLAILMSELAMLLLMLMDNLSVNSFLSSIPVLSDVLSWFSNQTKFYVFSQGLMRFSDLLGYFTEIVVFLIWTIISIEKRRWSRR